MACKVRNDLNKAADFDPKEGYSCSELRQPSKEVCSSLGSASIVNVSYEWEVCNTKPFPMRLDLIESQAKFSGGAVESSQTINGVKVVNVPIEHTTDANWEGRIDANSCVIVSADVDVDKCKATFDSELFVTTVNGKCSAQQTNGDWILRRCHVYVSVKRHTMVTYKILFIQPY